MDVGRICTVHPTSARTLLQTLLPGRAYPYNARLLLSSERLRDSYLPNTLGGARRGSAHRGDWLRQEQHASARRRHRDQSGGACRWHGHRTGRLAHLRAQELADGQRDLHHQRERQRRASAQRHRGEPHLRSRHHARVTDLQHPAHDRAALRSVQARRLADRKPGQLHRDHQRHRKRLDQLAVDLVPGCAHGQQRGAAVRSVRRRGPGHASRLDVHRGLDQQQLEQLE